MTDGPTHSPGRPTRPGLSREFIVATALALIDRDGLKALSMRRLGAELGTDPMAVYHHLPNKSALFDAVVEAVYREIDLDDLPRKGTWRGQTEWFMRRLREVLRRHPHALPVVGTRPAATPSMLAILDRALGVLVSGGLTAQNAIDMMNCVATYTLGHVLAEVGEPVGGESAPQQDTLAAVNPQTHPHLVKAFADGYEYRPDEQYEMGMRAMLDGFEARFAPGTGQRRRRRPG